MNPLYCKKNNQMVKKIKENRKYFTICSLPNLYAVSENRGTSPSCIAIKPYALTTFYLR